LNKAQLENKFDKMILINKNKNYKARKIEINLLIVNRIFKKLKKKKIAISYAKVFN